MKIKQFFLFFLTACVALSFTACSDDDEGGTTVYMIPAAKTLTLTEAQKAMVEENNAFSLRLFETVLKSDTTGRAVLVSPLSASYMLGMIQDGASSETRQQVVEALGMGNMQKEEVNTFFHSLITQLPEEDPNVTMLTANAIYTNKGYTLTSAFSSNMKKYYEAEAQSLDFGSDDALGTINAWSAKNSEGTIPLILDQIDPNAACYLLNSIYFDAKWTKQFDKANTRDEVFTREDGSSRSVAMMHNQALIQWYADADFDAVCLPYGSGSAWNMVVLLPREGKTVAGVAADLLETGRLSQALNNMTSGTLDVKMPKFAVSTNNNLRALFPKLGISRMFNRNEAQLDGICEGKSLFVTQMVQSTSLDVTEEGSKATAVTVAEMSDIYNGGQLLEGSFHADHPFVYLIMERNSNAIVMAGTYTGF